MADRPQPDETTAVIGMGIRVPGAQDVAGFWRNVTSGMCFVRPLSDAQLRSSGEQESRISDRRYVRSAALLDGIDQFDADLFGMDASAAARMDPQCRLFLECVWSALEDAGYVVNQLGTVGLFAGAAPSTYLMPTDCASAWQVANGCHDLVTVVSRQLDLHGPAISVNSACSTSLVAVHLACQSLLAGECEFAIAGAAAVSIPQERGYLYQEDRLLSPDGACRVFTTAARGSVPGNGVGVVLLRRLDAALSHGDPIQAVVLGSAVNSSGSAAAVAPNAAAQANVMAEAWERAGVKAESLQYVEANGIGHAQWDAAELTAMADVFASVPADFRCSVGSLKPLVGHLRETSGIAGMIRTALALKHGQLPPLSLSGPPSDRWVSSCLVADAKQRPWNQDQRVAGVSSFSSTGINAHVVMQQPPTRTPAERSRSHQLLVVSGRTRQGLEHTAAELAGEFTSHSDWDLADVAQTLQLGRTAFSHRGYLVCQELAAASEVLTSRKPSQFWTREETVRERPVAFLFPGVGGQYSGMGRGLYQSQATFRTIVDQSAEILREPLGLDIRGVMFSQPKSAESNAPKRQLNLRDIAAGRAQKQEVSGPLSRTSLAHSCLFVIEYALGQLLAQWGIHPQALIGHSLGEYSAACVAGVFSFEDGLRLLVHRAKRIEMLPEGGMLGVALEESEVDPLLDEELYLAAVNAVQAIVISGTHEGMDRLQKRLIDQRIAFRRLPATHAFHSPLISAASDELIDRFAELDLQPPSVPLISCATGRWITTDEVTDPRYWATQMCQTVRFQQGLDCLLTDGNHFLLEVGPGDSLASLAKQHPASSRERLALIQNTMRTTHQQGEDTEYLLHAIGRLWLAGANPDWKAMHRDSPRRRVSLPPSRLKRQAYWLHPEPAPAGDRPRHAQSPSKAAAVTAPAPSDPASKKKLGEWCSLRCWRQSPWNPLQESDIPAGECCLLLADQGRFADRLGQALKDLRHNVVDVHCGESFEQVDKNTFRVSPGDQADYLQLLERIQASGRRVGKIIHLWSLDESHSRYRGGSCAREIPAELNRRFDSLLALVQALQLTDANRYEIVTVTRDLHDVIGSEQPHWLDATLEGLCLTLSLESSSIACRNVDISGPADDPALISPLAHEVATSSTDRIVALRGSRRWIESFQNTPLLPVDEDVAPYRKGGVYLITGGTGGIGLALAEHLARVAQAKLILVSRTGLPSTQGPPLSAAARARLEQFDAIGRAGGEAIVRAADVTDSGQMKAVIDESLQHFGTIHGVFHLAAVAPFGLIQTKSPDMAAEVIYPKVLGALTLDQCLEHVTLDFFVLFSSASSVTGGGPGQADYAAANRCLDLFSRQRKGPPARCLSISWDQWQLDSWQDGLWGFPSDVRAQLQHSRCSFGISLEEGFEALKRVLYARCGSVTPLNSGEAREDRILARQWEHVVLTTRDLAALATDHQRFSLPALLDRTDPSRPDSQKVAPAHHPRPDLSTEFAAGSNEAEHALIGMWERVLRVDGIGVNDDFFELGGNSLLAVCVIEQLRRTFGANHLSPHSLYEFPTIRSLAAVVRRPLP